jgi:hypothetical protein
MNLTPPPIQPERPFDDNPESDPPVDSLLRELLGGDTPPNLIPKLDAVYNSVNNQRSRQSLFTQDELVAAVNRARDEVRSTTRSRADGRESTDRIGNSSWYNTRLGALALAASVVGLLAVYPFWRSGEGKKNPTQPKIGRTFPPMGSGSDEPFKDGTSSKIAESKPVKPSGTDPQLPANDPSAATASNQASKPVDTELVGNPKPETSIAEIAQAKELRSPKNILPDSQVVSVIDRQLEYLWQRLKIEPSKASDRHALEDRLAQVLIGRLPTNSEREWGRKAGAGGQAFASSKALTSRWIESEEFDRHWARALGDYYLDRSMAVDDPASVLAFDGWLQESIQQNRALGWIEGRLIASDPRERETPSIWLRRWMAAGKRSTHAVLEANGMSLAGRGLDQSHALESLALQGSRLSGAPAFSPAAIASESLPSDLLLGTAAAFASVFPSDKPGLFVSDAGGKVTLVAPTFPDGKPIAAGPDPRGSLAQWFEESTQARKPLVDFVWGRLVGQPLVPRIGLTDAEGLEERTDLLDFLATQAQSKGASLRQIVGWIALSAPLYFEADTMDAQKFLSLDPSSVAGAQRQTRLFAKYSLGTGSVPTAERLSLLSQWLALPDRGPSSVLAQPSTGSVVNRPGNNSGDSPPIAWAPERVRFEISNVQPYDRVGVVSAQLADSPLAWEVVVDRAFLACVSRFPSAEERTRADALLDGANGDRRLASARLLNALLGHL